MLHKLPSFDSDYVTLPICVFKGWHENCLKEYLFLSFTFFTLSVTATSLRFFFLKQIFIKKETNQPCSCCFEIFALRPSYDPALASPCSGRSVLGWIVCESTAGGSGERLFSRPYSSLYFSYILKIPKIHLFCRYHHQKLLCPDPTNSLQNAIPLTKPGRKRKQEPNRHDPVKKKNQNPDIKS